MKIIVDSREQAPLPFEVGGVITEVIVEGLPVGDYWMRFEDGREAEIVFERKSISDLWGTLTSKTNHERFRREIGRARDSDMSLILIIEGTLGDVCRGNPRSKFKGVSMLRLLFTMWVRYNLFPVFCKNRTEMMRFITETFEAYGREHK